MGSLVFYVLFVLAALAGLFAPHEEVKAQVPAAWIRGRVTDSSDAVIASADLTVSQRQTGLKRTGRTQADGRYQMGNLEPGEYEIEVRAQGFKPELRRLTLRVGDNATINIALQLGQLTEHVEVTGEAPGINTTDFKVDGSVSRVQIENLPLNGRNFLELARLEPGVGVDSVANPGAFGNNYQRVSIAGTTFFQMRISLRPLYDDLPASLFNVANLTGYSNVLNQLNYGQPSARPSQVFGTGGPRALQFAARLEF